MSRTSRALNRARQLIDTMQGREFTVSEFSSDDQHCLVRQLPFLRKHELHFRKKHKTKQIIYQAIKFPICTEDLPEPIRVEKKVSSKKDWVFRDWFPLPEFKVNAVYKHDGW